MMTRDTVLMTLGHSNFFMYTGANDDDDDDDDDGDDDDDDADDDDDDDDNLENVSENISWQEHIKQ